MTPASSSCAGEPRGRGVGKDRAADREALAQRLHRPPRESLARGRSRSPPGRAAARRGTAGRAASIDVGDALPRRRVGRRRQLPPVGPHAGRVDLRAARAPACRRRSRSSRGGITSSSSSWPVAWQACASVSSVRSCAWRSDASSSGWCATRHLTTCSARPACAAPAPTFGAVLERQRPRAGQLDRPADPPAVPVSCGKHVARRGGRRRSRRAAARRAGRRACACAAA